MDPTEVPDRLPTPTFDIPPSMGFQLLEKNDTGEFLVPSGWSIVGFHEMNDPGVQAAFQDLVKGPEDMDKYNTGQMKLLRMGGDNGVRKIYCELGIFLKHHPVKFVSQLRLNHAIKAQ